MIFSPAPKPERTAKPKRRSWAEKFRDRLKAMTPEERRAEFAKRNKTRKPLPRNRTPVKKRNEARIARKAKAYRKVLASDFHKKLRYEAFMRSGGRCECDVCASERLAYELSPDPVLLTAELERAVTSISGWFTLRGGESWQRFRSTEGELHHTSYKFFGDENPAELQHVQWVWKDCHKRIEAEHGTRRRFLSGRR